METSNYTTYDKPYPTIGDLIKGKDYDCISYRVSAKYCYITHELRLHQNDRCKRFTPV